MVTVKVKLEGSITIKRFIYRPNPLVTQFVLGPGYVAIENQALGLEDIKFQSLQFKSERYLRDENKWRDGKV